jgi:hypothetical protein
MGPDQDNANNNNNSSTPNSGTPPDGNSGMSSPPDDSSSSQQPMMGGDGPKKKMMWLWVSLLVLLLLLALFLGWWMMKDKDKKDDSSKNNSNNSSQQEKDQTATCADGLTQYENDELGFGFCYPTDWGAVTVADAKFEAADTGERWRVQFADKNMVNLGVVTEDWSTDAARELTCVDPAVQTLPAFSPFSTDWDSEGTPVSNASRGIQVEADQYLIREDVDDLLTNGVCVFGYTLIDDEVYTHTTATYSAEFSGAVMTPQHHIDNPDTLVPEADREEFYAFVKSVYEL